MPYFDQNQIAQNALNHSNKVTLVLPSKSKTKSGSYSYSGAFLNFGNQSYSYSGAFTNFEILDFDPK